MRITATNSDFEREPLLQPFGFKGGYLHELWQTVALMESDGGRRGVGLGTQSVLWSDASVFTENSEAAGNSLMYLMTASALERCEGLEFRTPLDLLDRLLPVTYDYGQSITGRDNLRLTFALNSLVAVDSAAWMLYCAENGITAFDEMLPAEARPALGSRHRKLGCVPLVTYGVAVDEVVHLAEEGYFLLKIKIGADPDGDDDREKMLEWDKRRLSEIHSVLKDRETPHTDDGHVRYCLDANGRYDSTDRLMRLLEHAEKIGALERVTIFEEPFPESKEIDVRELPVCIAADESAHSDEDARVRIEMGYGAIALKPIAKTMSMSLKIARVAWEHGVPCFCADLTVNPILVDWNKNVAARLSPLPGLKIGVIESNGPQNYRNWETMKGYHPCAGASWIDPDHGVFHLNDDFYSASGGIFLEPEHYSLRL